MSALQALCNPVWVCVTSTDPFATIFKLHTIEEEFERVSGSFSVEFENLQRQNEEFCIALLDEVKTEAEGEALMRYGTPKEKSECLG